MGGHTVSSSSTKQSLYYGSRPSLNPRPWGEMAGSLPLNHQYSRLIFHTKDWYFNMKEPLMRRANKISIPFYISISSLKNNTILLCRYLLLERISFSVIVCFQSYSFACACYFVYNITKHIELFTLALKYRKNQFATFLVTLWIIEKIYIWW